MDTQSNGSAEYRLNLTLIESKIVADGVVELTFERADGSPLPDWSPGAHIDLELGDGLVRQYSLTGADPSRTRWQVAVLREPEGRGGSAAAHALVPGARVAARGPRNHFALAPSRRYVFIAGGIGITPLIPMIAKAEAEGAAWSLAYGGRSAATMAYAQGLIDAYPGKVTLSPEETAGLLPLETLIGTPQPETLIYCCGPEPLLDAVLAIAERWPDGSLHIERFAPKEVDDVIEDAAFVVELATSGLTLTVPADRSILDVVTEAGVDVLTSCQEGTCGTCETHVLEGTPLHRDSILTDGEKARGRSMMICVSRAQSAKLVLDL